MPELLHGDEAVAAYEIIIASLERRFIQLGTECIHNNNASRVELDAVGRALVALDVAKREVP